DRLKQLPAAPSQRDEVDSEKVELTQIGIGRQLRVEDQFFRNPPRAFAPILDKAQDFVVLLSLAPSRVAVAEDPLLAGFGQKGQNPFLTAAALGDVVLFQQGVLAVRGGWCGNRDQTNAPGPSPVSRTRQTRSASASDSNPA